MTIHSTFCRIAGAAAIAAAMALGTGTALAQPAGGPHGAGGADAMIGHLIAHARSELNLNTMQQGMFDQAVADSKLARETMRGHRQTVKDAMQAELANAEPNLAAVAAVADTAAEQGRALRTKVRAEWLALYATFAPEQKAIMREMLQKRIAHGESFGQKMRERMHRYFEGTSG